MIDILQFEKKIVYHWIYLFKLDSNLNEKLKINRLILYEKLT